MKKRDKVKIIQNWWDAGLIKRLAPGMYIVPSNASVFGITPSLIAEVLEGKGEK